MGPDTGAYFSQVEEAGWSLMRALKPIPKGYRLPEYQCVYEKQVNGGPLIRCRYTNKGDGYCGIHRRMMDRRGSRRLVDRIAVSFPERLEVLASRDALWSKIPERSRPSAQRLTGR